MSGENLTPRAREIADACGDYIARHRHCSDLAPAPRPCPICREGDACGGWLRPVAGKPWLMICDHCGGAVAFRRAARQCKGR